MKVPTPSRLLAALLLSALPFHAQDDGGPGDPIHAARAAAIDRTRVEIRELIERYGGWDEIQFNLEPFREEIAVRLEEERFNQNRRFRVGGSDFQKGICAPAVEGEWFWEEDVADGAVPAPDAIIDFDRKLREIGVDLIVVPVPSKIEAYPHLFETEVPAGMPITVPRLDAMLYLLDAGVEVIDPLPTMLALMTEDDEIPVYERSGHHPSGISARDLGALVAERLERYALAGRDLARFTCEKRRAGERVNPGVPMWAWEVLEDGEPYDHVEDSEIVVIGDSNAFAFQRASWACHIARGAGVAVTDLSISSGGSTAHTRLAGQGKGMLQKRRVVVWIFASVALGGNWRLAEITDKPSFTGLVEALGVEEALARYHAPGARPEDFPVFEAELNNLGYQLLRDGKHAHAVEIFRINTVAFPLSANAFDSLGEAYARSGDKENAVASLKTALALNPSENTRQNSLAILAEMGVEFDPSEVAAPTIEALEAVVGEYELTEGNRAFVTVEEGTLVFEFVGQPKMKLEPISDVSFAGEAGVRVDFRTPASETSTRRLIVSGRGMRFEGNRIE